MRQWWLFLLDNKSAAAQSSGSDISEIAADIKQSAARALAGDPTPERSPPPRDDRQILTIAALCAAGIAVLLGGIGLYRNDPHRLPYMAVGIGDSAFAMQYVFWLAILICGVVLRHRIQRYTVDLRAVRR